MLTDRQSKFLNRMIELNNVKSTTTNKERSYLNRIITAIQEGKKFQIGVNMLTLSLKGLVERKEKPLTPDLELLYKDLVSVYGEPSYQFGDLKANRDSTVDNFFNILNSRCLDTFSLKITMRPF